MTLDFENSARPETLVSPGRRDAMRSLAGAGAALLAITGRDHVASAHAIGEKDGPAGPESFQVAAAKKKKGKRGRTGPTGPSAGTLSQNEATANIPANSNANAQANCPSGQATGGGASISDTQCELVSSNVVGTNAWGATGKCPPAVTATLTVRVICLG